MILLNVDLLELLVNNNETVKLGRLQLLFISFYFFTVRISLRQSYFYKSPDFLYSLVDALVLRSKKSAWLKNLYQNLSSILVKESWYLRGWLKFFKKS